MFRFFFASILIHGLLTFVLFLNSEESVILDPTVNVTFLQPSSNLQSSRLRARTAQPSRLQKRAEIAPSSTALAEAPIGETTFDTQTVNEKPRVLYQQKITYPKTAKEAQIEGPVKLSVTIDTTGNVVDVTVLEGPGFGLNEAASEAMKNFKFSPAQKEGRNVAVRITYIYRFKLESR